MSEKQDVDILCAQTGLSLSDATTLLQQHHGNVVDALTNFFSPIQTESLNEKHSFTLETPTQIHALRGMLNKANDAIQRMGGERQTMTRIVSALQEHQEQLPTQVSVSQELENEENN
jgi:hypothetical protein